MKDNNYDEWVRLAGYDIETVELLIKNNGRAEIIIYHIHQAIEKLLKAIILKNNLKVERVHFLDKLLSMIIKKYPELKNVEDEILEINLYLPKLRYPYGDQIEFYEAKYIYTKFKKIHNILTKILDPNSIN